MAWDDLPPTSNWDEIPPPESLKKKGLIRRGVEAAIESPLLPMAGGIAGGVAGTGLASIPLAGLLGAGGEGIRQIAARGLGIDAPKTSLESLKKIGFEGALNAIGEGAGQLAVKGGARVLAPAGRQLRKFFSATTGVPEAGFKALAEKPSLFITATKKAVKEAGEKVGSLMDEVTVKNMAPKDKALFEVEQAFKTNAANRVTAKKVLTKIAEGTPVGDGEVALANRAINNVIHNTNSLPQKALLQEQKGVLQEQLSKRLPELKEANKEFSKIKSASQFRNIGRLNKSGETSRLGSMLISGAAMKSPLVMLTSPAVIGAATAAGSQLAQPVTSRVIAQTIAQLPAAKILTEELAKKFLRTVKRKNPGMSDAEHREAARKMALMDGWKIPG